MSTHSKFYATNTPTATISKRLECGKLVGSNKSKNKKRDEVLFVIPHQQKRIGAGHLFLRVFGEFGERV